MGDSTTSLAGALQIYDRWAEDPRVELAAEPRGAETLFRQAIAPFALQSATKAVADCYLIGFAEAAGAHVVTFDRGHGCYRDIPASPGGIDRAGRHAEAPRTAVGIAGNPLPRRTGGPDEAGPWHFGGARVSRPRGFRPTVTDRLVTAIMRGTTKPAITTSAVKLAATMGLSKRAVRAPGFPWPPGARDSLRRRSTGRKLLASWKSSCHSRSRSTNRWSFACPCRSTRCRSSARCT